MLFQIFADAEKGRFDLMFFQFIHHPGCDFGVGAIVKRQINHFSLSFFPPSTGGNEPLNCGRNSKKVHREAKL
jgi:hypothetical protein